jgi:large subunit ribosomal protein L4
MMLDKFSKEGKVLGQVELNDAIFNSKINDVLLYELIKAANANLRQGTHATKQRSFVSGGGAKPYKQKGTGRARQGSNRAPQWKGGGTIFGPLPRDYRVELPRRIRQEAYRSLFTLKAKQGEIKVIEDINVDSGKTSEMARIGKALNLSRAVLIADGESAMIKRAIRNIPWFVYNNVKRISGREVFYTRTVVITESALKYLNEKFAKGE